MMTHRKIIGVLILSPIYFKLRPIDRWELVKEYYKKINSL